MIMSVVGDCLLFTNILINLVVKTSKSKHVYCYFDSFSCSSQRYHCY